MMVTIRGLPLKTKYQDVKVLLKNECSISEFILDDLVNDESGMSKKVRVGLVEDSDGYAVMKCLNGLRMPGNNVLRVEIVGKPPAGGQQGNAPYEHKPASSFNNEYRNNYSNQQTMDFRGRTNTSGFGASYPAQNTQFPGPTQSLGAPGVHGSISSHATVDSRPSPWVSNNTPSNQWNLNQPMGAQNSFQPPGNQGYTHQFSSNTQRSNAGTFVQGRGQHDQGYGYSAKTNTHDMGGPRKADTRHHVLRNVELVDTQVTNPPLQSGRYPPNQGFQQKPSGRYPPSQGSQQQQKSITIMKDNFQGATSYDMGSSNQPSPYQRQSQGSPQTWVQQEIRTDVYRNFEKPAQRLSPHRQVAPVGRSFSPTRRLISPSGRRPSPPRHLGPARGASPPRHLGPARGASPPRHLGPARGASPPRHLGPARGASPPRHLGPARGASPPRHLGPARGASPPRHLVPARGASPPRHLGSARGASPPRHLGPARGASPPRHLGPARGPSPPRHLGPTRGASPPRHSGPVSQPPPRHLGPARGASPPNPLPLGRRLSPSGRHQSPTRRLISPADRMMSTMDRRPGGPPRDLPQRSGRGNAPRYSPQRHHGDKPIDKNIDPETLKSSKHIRPAYDATSQAPNQPIYSGGFRPNVHDNAPFPRNTRQLEQDVPWQQDGDQIYAKMKKRDEEGPVASRQNTYGDKHSPRKSRSPIRRDRSPIRDRYRKHSPSSTSPRRSWAFEKRRSPEVHDAPLPPNWPGQEIRDDGRFKHASDRKEDNSKHIPVWEKQPFAKRDESKRGNEKIDSYGGPSKVFRGDLNSKVDTSRGEQFSKHHRDSKFGTRNEFENRPGYRQAADDGPKAYLKQKDQDYLYSVEHENIRRYGDSKRKGSPRRDEEKNNDFKKLDKDIENVYKRAQEFKQKTEELRKSQRRMKEHSEERGRTARIREEKDFEVHNAASTRRIDDITRRHMDDSPRRRMNNSPRHHMDDSPRRYMEDSPRRHIEGSPRHHMNNSPVRRMEVSPRRLIEGSPRRRMDNSPRRRMENSPRQRMENSPRRHVEGSPRRRVDDSAHQPRCDTDNRRRDEIDTKASLSREPIWNAVDESRNIFAELPSHIKVKRFKAAEEISNKLMNKKPIVAGLSREARLRVMEELKKTVSHKLNELFDTEDVSFIELVIKFKSRISDAEKDKIFDDVIKSLPSRLRNMKALGEDSPNVPSKRSSKLSSDYKLKEEYSDVPPQKKAKLAPENKIKEEDTLRTQGSTYIPEWKLNVETPEVQVPTIQMISPQLSIPNIGTGDIGISQLAHPQLVIPTLASSAQWMMATPQFDNNVTLQTDNISFMRSTEDTYDLFLCQDDFAFITAIQAELLKEFIVSEIIKVTENSQGWAPDFTFKGLQSIHRYVLSTKDEASRDWLINLDFSRFILFNVLVYTREELWYERAAIWLPGHSQQRKLEPLEKLKLQNKKLEGVNIGKWKMVKKIITLNGTRLYVDMAPSSARALEKHNMLLSYELQKVTVFLKAVAIDKNAFDAGLKEISIKDESVLENVINKAVIPTIQNSPSLLKIALSGRKDMCLEQARQVKENIIYHIYKYHNADGISRTDFINYGFIAPHYFGIIPENTETKRWLMKRQLGKLNRRSIIVIASDEDSAKYYRIMINVPNEQKVTALLILEKIKQSNQGVKGINFHLWKPIRLKLCSDKTKVQIQLDVDIQSVDTLIKMNYELDYMNEANKNITVFVESELSKEKLLQSIREIKKQSCDNYDVANMDLDSGSDNDDVICIG